MKRHKWFLILIALLLIINSAFFIAWYGFNLKGRIKNIIAAEIGKALDGKVTIDEFNFSERLIIARQFEFVAADSSLLIKAEELRIHYNLLKLLVSGFRIDNLLDQVQVSNPIVTLKIRQHERDKQGHSKPFRIPDLKHYFRGISITGGLFNLDVQIPVKLFREGELRIVDSFEDINLKASNRSDKTWFELQGISANQGQLQAKIVFTEGRLDLAKISLENYDPLLVLHPDIRGFNTRLSLEVDANQAVKNGNLSLQLDLNLRKTSATILGEYPLQVETVSLKGTQNKAQVRIAGLRSGTAKVDGYFELTDMLHDTGLTGSLAVNDIDLSLLYKELGGLASAEIQLYGSLKQPQIHALGWSTAISYRTWELNDVQVSAEMIEGRANARVSSARWENQDLSATASFDLSTNILEGSLSTEAINSFGSELIAYGSINFEVDFNSLLPMAIVQFHNCDLNYNMLELNNLAGEIQLLPVMVNQSLGQYLVDAKLRSSEGYYLNVLGDLLSRQLLVDLDLMSFDLGRLYAHDLFERLNPVITGSVRGYLDGNQILASSDLNLSMTGNFQYTTDLQFTAAYNTVTGKAGLNLEATDGRFNDEEVDLQVTAEYDNNYLNVYSVRISDLLSLSGSVNLHNLQDMNFDLSVMELGRETITNLYPPLADLLPRFDGLNLRAIYNWQESGKILANLNLREFNIDGFQPFSGQISLHGPPDNCLADGKISAGNHVMGQLSAVVSIAEQTALDARLRLNNLKLSNLFVDSPVQAVLNGVVAVSYTDFLRSIEQPNLAVDVQARQIVMPGLELDQIDLVAQQQANLLIVDAVSAVKEGLVDLRGSGALDYNLISNSYFEGNHLLSLDLRGELFNWLHKQIGYIQDASGTSEMQCRLGVREEQFIIIDGSVKVSRGRLVLSDQPEAITNINLSANILDNKLSLERFTARMGEGELRINNYFTEDSSNHFMAAMLDLGIFNLSIQDPGILVNVPFFTPTRSLSQLTLSGLDSEFATVMGPFDDMKIRANVMASRATVTYPPNTDNLLRLIYSVRDAALRRNDADALPLPFTMELLVGIRDNVSYVTYPANIRVSPGSFIHVLYDGQDWIVREASFTSDNGSVDFFGTVFQVDDVAVTIMDAQDLLLIQGNLSRRAPDGTIINLSVNTDNDSSKPFLDRLQLSLSSDNPQDRTISQILSRVRYDNQVNSQNADERDTNISNDALNLLSGNLNTTFISPFIYPFENSVRRFLKLDAFSLNFGFIQNLVNEYSNNADQMAEYTDMRQISSDIVQFSSAILLNNLSLNMSKYLFGRFYVDYKLTLQEATDLQQNTALLISHDTSLRMMLPWSLRMSYNFNYKASEQNLNHGLMLYRSFRFRGL